MVLGVIYKSTRYMLQLQFSSPTYFVSFFCVTTQLLLQRGAEKEKRRVKEAIRRRRGKTRREHGHTLNHEGNVAIFANIAALERKLDFVRVYFVLLSNMMRLLSFSAFLKVQNKASRYCDEGWKKTRNQ